MCGPKHYNVWSNTLWYVVKYIMICGRIHFGWIHYDMWLYIVVFVCLSIYIIIDDQVFRVQHMSAGNASKSIGQCGRNVVIVSSVVPPNVFMPLLGWITMMVFWDVMLRVYRSLQSAELHLETCKSIRETFTIVLYSCIPSMAGTQALLIPCAKCVYLFE